MAGIMYTVSCVIDSFERTLEKPETLLPAYDLFNRIRLCAADAALAKRGRVGPSSKVKIAACES
jgi:hypothetical protein